MSKKGERKIPPRYHLLHEDYPTCDVCGCIHATGSIDEWGCAACGGIEQEEMNDDCED